MNHTIGKTIFSVMLAILLMCTATPALAKVTAEEAAKLKTELNPMGGVRAGNAEGTIPEWTGGLAKVPEGIDFVPKSGLPQPDPYADDKILFTITAQNVDQYKDKLSPAQVRMFKTNPGWKMNIYPTRRSAAFSKEIYEGTYDNAMHAEAIDEYGSAINFGQGYPFPIPKTGIEAMLNYLYMPHGARNIIVSFGGGVMSGDAISTANEATNYYLFAAEGKKRGEFDPNDYIFGKIVEMTTAGRQGEIYLMMDPGSFEKNDALGWSYIPGTRRVRRNPNFFYDGVDSTGGGISVSDDQFMWKGKLDRFDWKLNGKKEMYVPYNTYMIDRLPDFHPILQPGFPKPEYFRWELHRVWEVEATLKEGARHIYSKRFFWLDEDSWNICVKDQYDKRGNLWRWQFSNSKQYYDLPAYRQTQYACFDFQVPIWVIQKFVNGFPPESYPDLPDAFFTIQNLRKMGRR